MTETPAPKRPALTPDEQLDEALEQTFPASDPPSMVRREAEIDDASPRRRPARD